MRLAQWIVPAGQGQTETSEQRYGVSVLALSYSPHDMVLIGELAHADGQQ